MVVSRTTEPRDDHANYSLIEMEYKALREEIIFKMQSGQNTIKFFLPLIGFLYVVPMMTKSQESIFLWAIVATIGSLAIFVVAKTTFSNMDAIRKIGMYIKKIIEPRTNNMLYWENANHQLNLAAERPDTPEALLISTLMIAHLLSLLAIVFVFLNPLIILSYLPFAISVILCIPSFYYFRRLHRFAEERKRYASIFCSIRNEIVIMK